MRDDYFFDGDGQPLTGKIPLQVRFKGSGDPNLIRGHANAALRAFLANVRNSLAPTHRKTIALPNGTMTMWHSYGSTRVEIELTGGLVQEEEFYGGILVTPKHLQAGDVYLTEYTSSSEYNSKPGDLVLYGEVTSSGAGSGRGGRPAFPNVKSLDVTESIVIQIAKDKPLGATPIKDGTVKIWRVKDRNAVSDEPDFQYYGYRENRAAEDKAYIFQLNRSTGLFFLANQHVATVPAFPALQTGVLAVRTFGMDLKDFSRASQAQGVVIVAHSGGPGGQFYFLSAVDTSSASPAWTELARVPPPPNPEDPNVTREFVEGFGSTYEEIKEQDGSTLIRCSGPGRYGPFASSFWVRVQPTPSGRLITGELRLAYYTLLPRTEAYHTISMSKEMNVIAQRHGPTEGGAAATYGSIIMSANGTYSTGADPYVAGQPVPAPATAVEWSYQSTETLSPAVFSVTPGTSFGDYNYYSRTQAVERSFLSTYKWTRFGVEQQTLTMSGTSQNAPYGGSYGTAAYGWDAFAATPVDLGFSNPGDRIVATARSISNRVQLREIAPTSAPTQIVEATPGSYTFLNRLETPSAGPPAVYHGEMFCSMDLSDHDGNVKYEWPDVYSLFPMAKPETAKAATQLAGAHTRIIGPPILKGMGSGGQLTNPMNIFNGLTYYEYYPNMLPNTYEISGESYFGVPGIFASRVYPSNGDPYFTDQNISASYSGLPYYQSYTIAEMGAAFPDSSYGINGGGPSGSEYGIQLRLECPLPKFDLTYSNTPIQRASVSFRDRVMIEDPRTGGFVFSGWLTFTDAVQIGFYGQPIGLKYANAHVSLIGNRFGAIPLQQVIEEWRALGLPSGQSTLGKFSSDDQVVWLEGGPSGLI